VDTSRLRSINQREDGVFVRTRCIRGEHACEFGAWFILKKVNGTWTIVKQQFWMT
jgi:murein tripeptide amidase MpaA